MIIFSFNLHSEVKKSTDKKDMTDIVMQKIAFAPFTGEFTLSGETVYLKQYDVYIENLRGRVKYDLGKFIADGITFQFINYTFKVTGEVFPEFKFKVKCDEELPVVDISKRLIRNKKVRSITDVLLLGGKCLLGEFSVRGTLKTWKVHGELSAKDIIVNLKPFHKWVPYKKLVLQGGLVYTTEKVLFKDLRFIPEGKKKELVLNGSVNILDGFPVDLQIRSDPQFPVKFLSESDTSKYFLKEHAKLFRTVLKGGTFSIPSLSLTCSALKKWNAVGQLEFNKVKLNLKPFKKIIAFSGGTVSGKIDFDRNKIRFSEFNVWTEKNRNPIRLSGEVSNKDGLFVDLNVVSEKPVDVTTIKKILTFPKWLKLDRLKAKCDVNIILQDKKIAVTGQLSPAGSKVRLSGIPVNVSSGSIFIRDKVLQTENLVISANKSNLKCKAALDLQNPTLISGELFTPKNINASSLRFIGTFVPELSDMIKKIDGPLRLKLNVVKGVLKKGYINAVSVNIREYSLKKLSGKIEFTKDGFSGDNLSFYLNGIQFRGSIRKALSGKIVFDFGGSGMKFKGNYDMKSKSGLSATVYSIKSINVSVLKSFSSFVPEFSEMLASASGPVKLKFEISGGNLKSGYIDAKGLNIPIYDVQSLIGKINITRRGFSGNNLRFDYKTLPLVGSINKTASGKVVINYSNSNLPLGKLRVFKINFLNDILPTLTGYFSLSGKTVMQKGRDSNSDFNLKFVNCGLKENRNRNGQGSVAISGKNISIDLRNVFMQETITGTINNSLLNLTIQGKDINLVIFKKMISRFLKLPDDVKARKGKVNVIISVTGSTTKPAVTGNIRVRQAELRYQTNFVIINSMSLNISPFKNSDGFKITSSDSSSSISIHYIPSNPSYQRLYFPIRNIKFNGIWQNNRLKIPILTCNPAYSRQPQGNVTIKNLQVLVRNMISYSMEFSGSGLNVRDITKNNTPLKDSVVSTGSINGKIQGNSSSIDTLTGNFNISFSGGYFNQFPPLVMMANMLHAPALGYEKISAGDGRLQIRNHHFILLGSNLQTANTHISSHGQISFNTSVDLKLKVFLAPTTFLGSPNKIPETVLRRGVSFTTKVRGTLENPKIKPDFSAFSLFPIMNAPLLTEATNNPEGVPQPSQNEQDQGDKKINIFDLLLRGN